MIDYTGNVLGAIDLIVQERMKDLKFDKTIVCTIVENKGEGLYIVDDGSTTFEAVSDLISYPAGFQVNVLIPQGDYKNQKTITGRYIANTDELNRVRYMTPFDNCLDASGNIMAEGNYKIEGKDYNNVYSLLANDESRTEIPIWEYSFPEDMMNGCPYLGLAADFFTGLSDYMPISGSYGFHLMIEGEAKENMEINRDYYFDSSDMYGNPYLFETYFRQEKVFDISNYKKLKGITLSFYQNNDFNYNLEGEIKKVPFRYTDITGEHKMPDNIMAKNLYLFLGYNLSDFEKDTVLLFTTSNSTYDFEIPETGKKDMKITWIRKDGSTTYIQEEKDLTPSIRIHWYIKDKTSKADPIAGDGWKEISNGFSSFIYENYQLPNLKTEETRIKVIVTEGSFDETHSIVEEAARITNKYESNILIFTSSRDDIPDKPTVDVLTGLELKIINDTYQGNYRIYGEDKKLKNASEGVRIRSIIPILKLGDKEIELTKEDQVIWEVPTVATMINLVTSASNINENTNAEIKQEGNAAKLDYKIRKTYLETYINNTVKCTVIHKGTEYSKNLTMYFGPTGTAGTEYTFVIEPEDGFEAYTINSKKPIKLSAKLYDYNDELVEWVNQTIKWDWATEDETGHAFDGVANNTGAYITLTPKDGLEVENFDWNNYLYNLIKATVSTDVVYKTSVPKMDEKGNYLDANDNVLEVDDNGDVINFNKIVWTDGTTEPRVVTMTAYYGVPIRTNEKYFMTGATSVYYNDDGANPIYEKIDYKLYGIDENIDSKWEVIFSNKDEKNKGIENFIPQIVESKTNGYQLKPKPMFIQDLPKEISIICYTTNKIESGAEIREYFWIQPLIISQNKYASSLLNQWDGSLTINEKDGTILSTMVGAGIKNKDNTFSGVLMGDVEKGSGDDAIKELGLYGYHHGVQSFGFKIDGTAFIGKAGTGRINFDGNKGIIESGNFIEERGDIDGAGTHIDLKDGLIKGYGLELIAKGSPKNSSDWEYKKVLVEKQVFQTGADGKYVYETDPIDFYLAGAKAYSYDLNNDSTLTAKQISDDESYEYKYVFSNKELVKADESYINELGLSPIKEAVKVSGEKDAENKIIPDYYKIETDYFSLDYIIKLEDSYYAKRTNQSDDTATRSFVQIVNGEKYTLENFGIIYKAEKYNVKTTAQKVEEWQYVLKKGVEKWKRPIITLSTQNQDKIFSVELQDYDNNTGKYGKIKPLIHISDDLAYIQSEGFKNDNTSFLKGTGIQMVFSTNEKDKSEYPLGVQISGMWLAMNKGSNRLSINSNSSSFPFEIGKVENGQIHNGFRIGWNGLCEWGVFGNQKVSISSSGIVTSSLSTSSLSVGGESLDAYIRSIVNGMGFLTSLPPHSHSITLGSYSSGANNSEVPGHSHYVEISGATSVAGG